MSEVLDSVTGVHLFPIKSCHEATVDDMTPTELTVGITGFYCAGAVDRGWDESESIKHPEDKLLSTVSVDVQIARRRLEVAAPDHGTIAVPLDIEFGSKREPIRIFGRELWSFDEGEEAAHFFSELLGRSVRLVRADPSLSRVLPEEFHRPGATNRVAGADGMPFLLTSQASLDQVIAASGANPAEISLNRYRGNIEINGQAMGPFGEDSARLLRIGSVSAFVVKACSRCPIPNINQDTGVKDNLSTKVLRSRSGWRIGFENLVKPPKPFFGQNLNHVVSFQEPSWQQIRVGDEVEVVSSGLPNVVLKTKK